MAVTRKEKLLLFKYAFIHWYEANTKSVVNAQS